MNDKFYTISSGMVMVTSKPLQRRSSKQKMEEEEKQEDGNGDSSNAKKVKRTSEVSVEEGKESVGLGTLGPGEYFGEMALMSDAPRR